MEDLRALHYIPHYLHSELWSRIGGEFTPCRSSGWFNHPWELVFSSALAQLWLLHLWAIIAISVITKMAIAIFAFLSHFYSSFGSLVLLGACGGWSIRRLTSSRELRLLSHQWLHMLRSWPAGEGLFRHEGLCWPLSTCQIHSPPVQD